MTRTLHHAIMYHCKSCQRWHCECQRCTWVDFHDITFTGVLNELAAHQREMIAEAQRVTHYE